MFKNGILSEIDGPVKDFGIPQVPSLRFHNGFSFARDLRIGGSSWFPLIGGHNSGRARTWGDHPCWRYYASKAGAINTTIWRVGAAIR